VPALDLWPLLEKLPIKPKTGKIKPLRRDDPFAWAQRQFVAEVERQYNAGLPVRIIVLKGRQVGLSTVTEAILFLWAFLHEGSRGLVISKENDKAEELFNMTRLYWDQGPFHGLFNTKYYTKNEIVWEGINSSITSSTAKKEDVGRGGTRQAVHCSEVAFWERSEDMVPSVMESIPNDHGTICILESTANGVGGYFHETWMDATNRANEFVPMFFPWFLHFEYEIPNTTLKVSDLDDEEFSLLQRYPEMTLPKLAWRRMKIAGLPGRVTQFHAEYPCAPEEAFLSTGRNVFPLETAADCYDPNVGRAKGYLYNANGTIDFCQDLSGHFTVFRYPDSSRRQQYVVAVDPTRTVTGDPACIQVLNRATLEQVAVWHGHAGPEAVGEISLAIAHWYHQALMNTEIQGGGKSVMEIWRSNNYPHIWLDRRADSVRKYKQSLGFYTTFTSKQILLGSLIAAFQRKQVLIHHPTTYHQICQYVALGTGHFGPARRSGEDDCVMSFCIAVYTALSDSNTMTYLANHADAQISGVPIVGRQQPLGPPRMENYGGPAFPGQRQPQNPILVGLDEWA
jgi:hypothetical protein